MPMYEYECEACGAREDHGRRVAERDDPALCGACGSQSHRIKVNRGTSFALKGGGWYADGYAKKP